MKNDDWCSWKLLSGKYYILIIGIYEMSITLHNKDIYEDKPK